MMHAQLTTQEGNEASTCSGAGALSDLDLLARGCCGPLDQFGAWGGRESVYVGVKGPPESRKYFMGVWKSEKEFLAGGKGKAEIDLLKVTSVQPDPGRPEVFVLNYMDSARIKQRLTFRRDDRPGDVWVEMFQLLLKM